MRNAIKACSNPQTTTEKNVIVWLNQYFGEVSKDSLDAFHARVVEELALFHAAAQRAQNRGQEDVAEAFRAAAAEIRSEIQRDINIAHLRAAEAV